MVSDTLKNELLEERHSIRVLVLLQRSGPTARTAFYPLVAKGMTTVMQRINLLIQAGLIEEQEMTSKPFAKIIRLSPRGEAVAAHLAAIEELLTD